MTDRETLSFFELPRWYAVQVAPKHEMKVVLMLGRKGCVYFLPTYKSKRKWSDRIKLLELPLFPGYVFCQITKLLTRNVLSTPGVRRIIGFGGKPYPLADEEIHTLQRVAAEGSDVRPGSYLAVGERVEVISGPLAGVSGLLTHFKNQQRLVISVDLTQQSVSIEVDSFAVTASQRNNAAFRPNEDVAGRLPVRTATSPALKQFGS